MTPHLEKCCDICGDPGYKNSLVSCSKCRTSQEHLYCMHVVLVEVPDDWLCEECVPHNSRLVPGCGGRQNYFPGKEVGKTAKVKFLPAEDVIRLSSQAIKKKHPCKSGSSFLPPKSPTPKVKSKPLSIATSSGKPPGHSRMQISPLAIQHAYRISKEQKAHVNPVMENICKEQQIASSKPAQKSKPCNLDVYTGISKSCNTNMGAEISKTCIANVPAVTSKTCNANVLAGTSKTCNINVPAEIKMCNADMPAGIKKNIDANLPAGIRKNHNTNMPAEKSKTCNAKVPTGTRKTYNANVPAGKREVCKANILAEKSKSCNMKVPARTSETCNANAPAEKGKDCNTNIPAEKSKTFNAKVPAGASKTCNADVPAGTSKKCNANVPAEKGKAFNANVPAKKRKICNGNNAEEAKENAPCILSAPACGLPVIGTERSSSCIVSDPKTSDIEGRDWMNMLPKLRLYRPYLPALHATWKGGFKFFDTATPAKFYGGFQAQPPCRVHRKAYNYSKTMPITLHVELLPQHHVWADLFQNSSPQLDCIALYVFPDANNRRSKENFASLCQLMEIQNSAMRCCIDGVDLLIFTSKLLHKDSQDVAAMLRLEFFMWGVYHRAKTKQTFTKVLKELTSVASPSEGEQHHHPNMDCAEVVDMEIDMLGGEIVDTVDPSRKVCEQHYNYIIHEDTVKRSSSKGLDALKDTYGNTQQDVTSIASPSESEQHHHPNIDCAEVVDMEIDMLGGKIVDTVDSSRKVCEQHYNYIIHEDTVKRSSSMGLDALRDTDGNTQQDEDALMSSNNKNLGAYKDADANNQQVHLEPEQTQNSISTLFQEASQMTSSDLASVLPLQSTLERLSDVRNEVPDIPPGFGGRRFPDASSKTILTYKRPLPGDEKLMSPIKKENSCIHEYVQSLSMKDKTESQPFKHKLRIKSLNEMHNMTHWILPPAGWVKLNVKGISRGNPGAAGACGMVRDELGDWVLGYIHNLGIQNSLTAELWALSEGLMITWQKGCRKVLVESECIAAVEILKMNPSKFDPNRALIECCRSLLKQEWDCKVYVIHKDANLCAYRLVTYFEEYPLGLTNLSGSPINLFPLLQDEKKIAASRTYAQLGWI